MSLKELAKQLEEKYKCPIWKTREGELIPIIHMTDNHLLNAYRFVDKRLAEITEATMWYLDPFWGPHGEMAQDAADRAMEEAWDKEAVLVIWLGILGGEILRRRLLLPERTKAKAPPRVKILPHDGPGTIAKIERDCEGDEFHD